MKKSLLLILSLSVILLILSLFFQSYADSIPRWWGFLVGGIDTLVEDGILTSALALV
jgi:hypothetical protein